MTKDQGDRFEHTPWWFWLPGRRGNDGLTRRQRRWYAESFERTYGRDAIAAVRERRRTNGS